MRGSLKAFAVLALYCVGFVATPHAYAAAQVREVRLTSDADTTRLIVDTNARATHRVFKLANPERIVLDLRDTVATGRIKAPAPDGLVSAVRIGPQPKRTLRLVLETRSSASAKARWTTVKGKPRLILDLRSGADFAASEVKAPSAAPAAPVRAAHAPGDSGRDIIIAVDAGHGGVDPGASGRGGTREKDVVLKIARALAKRIDAEPGMRAVLTRDGDHFIPLRERNARARAAKADLFVSIHADAIPDPSVAGASVYVLSERGATSEAARWLAERENAADLKGGVPLNDKDAALASVLLDLSQTASITASMTAAEKVLASIDRVGVVRKPKVQQAGFVVLKSPDIPSMLVETAYISNPGDERRLRSSAHQVELAEAIFRGINRYFDESPPEGTLFAQRRRGGGLVVAGAGSPP